MTTDTPSDAPAHEPSVPPDVATHATPADAQNAADNGLAPPPPPEPPKPEDETPTPPPADEAPAEEKPEAPTEKPADEKPAEAAAAPAAEVPLSNKHWYVVKVQSGREETVKEAIERKVRIEGMEKFFGQVVVPMERETVTIQSGKRKGQKTVKKRKKYPGYIFAEIEYNQEMQYLFRETSGVGDFVGATGPNKPPPPMPDREVASMLRDQDDVKGMPAIKEKGKKAAMAPVKIPFSVGDKVRVKDGIFAGQEGEVKEIREPKDDTETHRIRVELTVFGRPTQVQLEYWQIENV